MNIFNKNQNQIQALIVYIVLTVVTLAVFWQVNQFDFVNFDDPVYVTENSHIQSGITLDGFRWAFSTRHASFWHPLTWLSLMFDYQLFGLNAGCFHLTNLILHILSTLLLFWLFNRMTGAIWRSAFVAAFFAFHPLHVESVAWIAERKDVLSAFFWMLTICLYIYYTEKPAIKRYLLVLFFFVCALLSKPMVVTLPVIMILLDYWPLKRFISKKGNWVLWQLKEKILFFVLSAVFSIIALYAQYKPSVKDFPLNSRLANAPVSFMNYLEKTFWPHDMAVFYPFSAQIPFWQVLGSSLLIIIISASVIVMVKRLPYLFVGWFWYAVTILPVTGIIQVGDFAMADRYYYLPSIGIGIMLAWGIPLLFKREDISQKILFPAGTAFLVILAFLTWQQCVYWKNSIELSKHALRATKNNHVANNILASALFRERKIEESIDYYNEALRINPYYASAYCNRGIAYAALGQHQRAIGNYNKAIQLQPELFLAYYNRGNAYAELGRYQSAIEDFNKAFSLKPDSIDLYNSRGNAYTALGQHRQALEDFNNAIRINSNNAVVYNNRGAIWGKLGQYQRAVEDFNEAIYLKQDYADAYNNRAMAYLNQANKKLGCFDARKACELGNCKIFERAKNKGYCY